MKLNISAVQLNVTACQAELASERADRLLTLPQGAGQGMPPRHLPSKLGPGQLPDINPDAVSVVRKETNGMTFHRDAAGHWLPIIVQGDPRQPRARPSVSVMDIKPSNKTRVKKNASILGSPGLAIGEAGDHEEAIIPRGSSSRRPVSVASYVSSSSQSNNEIPEAPGVVPAPKVVVNG